MKFKLASVAALYQSCQQFGRGAAVDGLRGQAGALARRPATAGGPERRRRVQDHDVTRRAGVPRQHAADDRGALVRTFDHKVCQGAVVQPEIGRSPGEVAELAARHFRGQRGAAERDLVQAVRAMDHDRVFGAEHGEGLG